MNLHPRIHLVAAMLALCLAPLSALRADDNDRVAVGSDNHIAAGQKAPHDAVAVMGSLTVDGDVAHDSVAVCGSNILNGSTGHDDVAVLGDVAVNGRVGHDVVSVFGDITLGPNARVEHDVVCVGGTVHRDPGAVIGGNVVEPGPFGHFHPTPHGIWWTQGLGVGKVLPLGLHLGLLWVLHLAFLVLYALIALVFPRGVRRCGDVLVERPGMTLLTGFLTVLALPILFLVLLITVIGIPVALLALPVAVACLFYFGKASLYALIGRWMTGDRLHPATSVLVGGLAVLLLCLVPWLGLMVYALLSSLGFACATTALFSAMQRPGSPKATVPPPAPTPMGNPAVAQPPPVPPEVPPAAFPSEVLPPVLVQPPLQPPLGAQPTHASLGQSAPQISFIGLPRAGFWIRAGALLIDLILVGMVADGFGHMVHVTQFGPSEFHAESPGMLPLLALYGALMWKLRGTTVGGIIFGLKVVRLDDRPIDWATAIVRALGCFLSLVVFGLGFIWVAFDQEKQSWHDKIAGTVVVRVPKGVSLI
jgi:uncharacterized RDD family membrane protein YckC